MIYNVCVWVLLNEKKSHADRPIGRKNAATFDELNRKSSSTQLRRQQPIKDIYLGKLFIIFIVLSLMIQ